MSVPQGVKETLTEVSSNWQGFIQGNVLGGISSVKLSYFLFVYQETNQAKHKRRAIAKVGYY